MATRKTTKKQTIYTKDSATEEAKESYPTVFDYLRFGESYTSLLLGVVVVIVLALLFIAFFRGGNNLPNTNLNEQISATNTENLVITPTVTLKEEVSITPTRIPTNTPTPTMKPTATPRPTNTPTPTVVAKATNTPVPTMKPTATPLPTPTQQATQPKGGTTYTIVAGDNLWSIAEKTYNDGYKWTEIAKANKLQNPNVLNAGTKLTLPKLDVKKEETPSTKATIEVPENQKIKGNTYKVVKGDDLWNIAVRAYGNGYRWNDIAKANNLVDPNLIFSGNTLKIPR